jgi:cell division protein FtsZ
MNIDFQDLKTIMSYKGTALMGTGQATGETSALDAIKKAIESPLFDNASLKGATGVLVHYQIHPDYSFMALEEAMNYVYKNVNEDLDDDEDLMFGTTINYSLEIDEVQVTIVATGFDKIKNKQEKIDKEAFEHQERIKTIQSNMKKNYETIEKDTIRERMNNAQNMLSGDLSDISNNLELPSILRKK